MLVLAILPRLHARAAVRCHAILDPLGSRGAGVGTALPCAVPKMRPSRRRTAVAGMAGYQDRQRALADPSQFDPVRHRRLLNMGASNPERDGANLLGANAGKELYGRCLDCKTARRFAIAPLAGQFGPPTHIAHLSRRLKCRECGRRLLQFRHFQQHRLETAS
jgi:hypothetical protein